MEGKTVVSLQWLKWSNDSWTLRKVHIDRRIEQVELQWPSASMSRTDDRTRHFQPRGRGNVGGIRTSVKTACQRFHGDTELLAY